MTLDTLLQQISQLSDDDKLAVIEATARMLRQTAHDSSQSDAIAEVASLYRVDEEDEEQRAEPSQQESPFPKPHPKLAEVIRELMSRPDPEPEQMLKRGLFEGLIFNEEDFKAAEYRPSDEELDNAGLSVHR